jgi:hypothetical protein
MIYGRCKCGKREFWGSGMEPPTCCPCKHCGTVPAHSPHAHPAPTPHDWYQHMVDTDAGPQPLSRCRLCHRTRKEIEALERSGQG